MCMIKQAIVNYAKGYEHYFVYFETSLKATPTMEKFELCETNAKRLGAFLTSKSL